MADIARMRTISQLALFFKEQDPETSITEYYLRQLVKQKKIPVFLAGKKQLINLDKLLEYLNHEQQEKPTHDNDYGKIRRVE